VDDPEIPLDIAALFGAEPVHGERFSVYVPDKDRNGGPVPRELWVEEALALLSKIGGGATAMPAVDGAWFNQETGNLIREQPRVVYSYIIPEQFLEHRDELVAFVKRLGRETNQGAVAIEFDGVLYYVDNFLEQE
jgi:hypothetical protein